MPLGLLPDDLVRPPDKQARSERIAAPRAIEACHAFLPKYSDIVLAGSFS